MTGPDHVARALELLVEADGSQRMYGAGHVQTRGLVEMADVHLRAAELALQLELRHADLGTDYSTWDVKFTRAVRRPLPTDAADAQSRRDRRDLPLRHPSVPDHTGLPPYWPRPSTDA